METTRPIDINLSLKQKGLRTNAHNPFNFPVVGEGIKSPDALLDSQF